MLHDDGFEKVSALAGRKTAVLLACHCIPAWATLMYARRVGAKEVC